MTKKQIIKWNEQEDLFLGETVLKFLREGKTRRDAFEYVASELTRTKAGVSKRWNDKVKDRFEKDIKLVKQTHTSIKKENTPPTKDTADDETIETIHELDEGTPTEQPMMFVNQLFHQIQSDFKKLETTLTQYTSVPKEEYIALQKENESLREKVQSLEIEFDTVVKALEYIRRRSYLDEVEMLEKDA